MAKREPSRERETGETVASGSQAPSTSKPSCFHPKFVLCSYTRACPLLDMSSFNTPTANLLPSPDNDKTPPR